MASVPIPSASPVAVPNHIQSAHCTTSPGNVFCLSDEDFDAFWGDTIEATGINWLDDFTNQTDLDAFRAQGPIMDAKYREFGERCLQGPNATTLQYVGTAATVRDLVGLADAVLGPDTPIYYWGLSYGTVIGAWFANSASPVSCIYQVWGTDYWPSQCSPNVSVG